MLQLDPAHATRILTATSWFQVDHPTLPAILAAFHHVGAIVPADAILPIVPWLRAGLQKVDDERRYRQVSQYAFAVLSRSAPAVALPLVADALASNNAAAKWGATEAWAVLHDV